MAGDVAPLPAELLDAARAFAASSLAPATRRAYRAQWQAFDAWCQHHRVGSLPARVETVCAYLAHRASRGAKVATIGLALAALGKAHEAAGHPSPRLAPAVRLLMRGIRRELGVAPVQREALLVPAIRAMVSGLQNGPAGVRDRALLLLGFAGAFRRSELVSLLVQDVAFDSEGLRVLLRRSKTDQEGRGATVPIPFGAAPETCPVRAVRAWVELLPKGEGPLLRPVTSSGRILTRGLAPKVVAQVVKRHCRAAGLDPARFAGHSLRSGFATSAAKAGREERDIARQTRHAPGSSVLRRYIRDTHLFKDCAAKGLL